MWPSMKACWSRPAPMSRLRAQRDGGMDLDQLREAVEQEFLNLDEREQSVRSVMAKLESGFHPSLRGVSS